MYKGVSTLDAYELCLKRGLCHYHLKEFDKDDSSVPNINDLPRNAFLFIRINILSTILFKKSTKCEKIKILLQRTPVFSRILAKGDASEAVDDIFVLDSVVIFTLCELSKICCTAALFQIINENTGNPEIEQLKKLLLVDRIEGPILHHLYPLLQENFIGFDLDLIKVSYVLTLLFVRNYCVKLDIKTALKTIEEDFKGDMCWEDFKKMGDAASKSENYKDALQAYSSAVMLNSYSSELFAQKAQVCLKLGKAKAAQLDAYISIIINPDSPDGYLSLALSYMHQKLYQEAEIITKYGLTICEKDESTSHKKLTALIANLGKSLFSNKSSESITENLVDDGESAKYFPELVDSDSDDSDKEIYVENIPELVDASDSDESENTEKKTVNTHIKNKTKKKRVLPIPSEDSLDGTSIDMDKVCACLKEASEALLSDCGYKAVQIFRGPLRNFMESSSLNSFEENEIVCIKYAYGLAYCKSGGYDDLLKGITILKEITEKHDSVTFPAANYAIGLAYRKLNRFKDALNHLETVNNFLSKGIHFKVYSWPEIITVIPETKPEVLKDLVQELIKECENPPNPDALCRYAFCSYQPTIYYSDPDFKGYTSLFCSEQCCLQYHLQCWKTMKAERNITDKEFLEQNCFTPDCEGIFIKIQNIDKKGDVAKEFASDFKKSSKQKSTKWEKKTDIKEKKKKKTIVKSEDGTQEISSENGRSSSRKNSTSSDKSNVVLISGCVLPSAEEGASSSDGAPKSVQNSKSMESKSSESSSASTNCVQEIQAVSVAHENKIESSLKEAKKVTSMTDQEVLKISEDSENHIKNSSKPENAMKIYASFKEEEIKLSDTCYYSDSKNFVDKDKKSAFNFSFLSESIKKNVYSYMSDFLQHHGPLRIDDQLLMNEVSSFPEEANAIIAEFGGIVEFLKRDMRFACVADKYICVIADIAKAYQMNINSLAPDLEDFPPLENTNCSKYNPSNKDTKHPNFNLNPNAMEYKPPVKKKEMALKINASDSAIISDVSNSTFSLKSGTPEFSSDSNNSQKNVSNSQEAALKINSCPNFNPVSSVALDSKLMELNGDVTNIKDNSNRTKQNFDAAYKNDVNFKLSSLDKSKNMFISVVDLPSCDKDFQISSSKILESSKIKNVQIQLLPVLKEYCNEQYKNYHSYVNSCIKPYCLRKLPETATKGTETDLDKMEIPPAEHSKQIADALKAINKQLTMENTALKDQLKATTSQKDELLGEIYSLKLTLTRTYEDFEMIKLEHRKKEEKLVNGREYLVKCLADSHTSIDELKKRISVLEAVKSRFEKNVEVLEVTIKEIEEKKKKELEEEEKKYSEITKNFLKENSELKSRVKFAEIKYLQTKKTEYLNRIEDKLIDADLKKQEFTQGLSMISGNLNPMIHSSMKTIYAELSVYVKELNALKSGFVKTIDEQIAKVENGVSLQDLNTIEQKKIPDPPHIRKLLPGADKSLPSSSHMDFNLFNFGTSPQMPSAAIIPSSVTPAVVAPQPAFSTSLLMTTVLPQTKPSAPVIPQMSPSPTILPQTAPLAAVQAIPAATVRSQTVPLATIIPLVAPSATIVPHASPSATVIPQATPSTAIVPSSSPAATVISSLPAVATNLKSSLDLNSQLSDPFKNSMNSLNSFTGMPPTVPTVDPEFNKTCAIFKPPDPVSSYKPFASKVPPGIVGSTTSSVSSRTASTSSKDSSEAFPSCSSKDALDSFPPSSSKDSLETFPSVEKTLSSISSVTKVTDPGSSTSQVEKKTTASKTGSSYDKLLKKLKEHFPSYTQEELISFVKEFRSQRHGKLTGLPIDTIISELKMFIQGKENQKKLQEQRLAQLQPKPNKVLVNKKIVPDPKACPPTEQQQSVKKKSAWGIEPDNKKTFSGNIDDDCTICCDPMSKTSAYKVGCGHFFHEECIREWLKNKSNCPVCRVLLLLPEEYPSLS